MLNKTTFTADFGRDNGKTFTITEMSAYHAEMWAIRALLAIGKSGVEIPDELVQQGLMGLIAVSYLNLLKIDFKDAKPLLDDMMDCVKFAPSKNIERQLIDSDIEEVKTRLQLRKAVWDVHTAFFLDASASTSESNQQTPNNPASSTIKTPRKQ